MENLFVIVPVFGVIALLFAAYLAAKVSRQSAGNERMREIAGAISEGARPSSQQNTRFLSYSC